MGYTLQETKRRTIGQQLDGLKGGRIEEGVTRWPEPHVPNRVVPDICRIL
jgi:hypothetical protein